MTIRQLLVIIILCLRGPLLCVALHGQAFYFPDFTHAAKNLIYNGSAFMNPSCSCVWLTKPPEQQTTSPDNYILYGGVLRRPLLTFYDNSSGDSSQPNFEPNHTVHASSNQTIRPAAVNQTLPPISVRGPPPPLAPAPPPPLSPYTAVSFNVNFQFILRSRTGTASQGAGLCFLLSNSSTRYLDTRDKLSHFGVFPNLGGNSKANIWALEFDTHQDLVVNDIDNNHVGINVNSAKSVISRSLHDIGLQLYSNYSINVWINYNFPSRLLVVKIWKAHTDDTNLTGFIIVPNLDITTIFSQDMYAGFASRGTDQDHIINFWSVTLTTHTPKVPTAPRLPDPPPPVISSPPPPAPPPVITLPPVGEQVEVGSASVFVGWSLVLTIILLALRFTRRGQRILWRVYGRCKLCHRFCNLRVCLCCCTLSYDANGNPRKNRGRPLKKKQLKPKAGKRKNRKAVGGRKPQAGTGKKRKTKEGRKPQAGTGKTLKPKEGRKPQAGTGKTLKPKEGRKPQAGTTKTTQPTKRGITSKLIQTKKNPKAYTGQSPEARKNEGLLTTKNSKQRKAK